MNYSVENIGKNIHRLRTEKHMKQVDLGKKIGLERTTISNWENNKSIPSSAQLLQLAEVFQITPNDLLRCKEQAKGNEEEHVLSLRINLDNLTVKEKNFLRHMLSAIKKFFSSNRRKPKN